MDFLVIARQDHSAAIEDPRLLCVDGRLGHRNLLAPVIVTLEAELGKIPQPAAGQQRVTDKMPTNFFFAGPIHLALRGRADVYEEFLAPLRDALAGL